MRLDHLFWLQEALAKLQHDICPVPVVALGQLCWLLPAKSAEWWLNLFEYTSTKNFSVCWIPLLPENWSFGSFRIPLAGHVVDQRRTCSASAETPMSRFNSAKSSFPRSLTGKWLAVDYPSTIAFHKNSWRLSVWKFNHLTITCQKSCLIRLWREYIYIYINNTLWYQCHTNHARVYFYLSSLIPPLWQ